MSSDADADFRYITFEIYTLLMKSLLSSGFVKNHSELRHNAIVADLKRDYPSLYIECLTEGLISTETEESDVI